MRQGGACWEFKEQRFFSLLFVAWLEISEENKKLYKQKALLSWFHHTLVLLLSSYATDMQEALTALKMKLMGPSMEGNICNMDIATGANMEGSIFYKSKLSLEN